MQSVSEQGTRDAGEDAFAIHNAGAPVTLAPRTIQASAFSCAAGGRARRSSDLTGAGGQQVGHTLCGYGPVAANGAPHKGHAIRDRVANRTTLVVKSRESTEYRSS